MGKKILAIDDEPSFREMLGIILKYRGYDVVGVGTPEEAIQTLLEKKFDLIFLDITLKQSNGLDLIKPIKEIHPDIPIVILTGSGWDKELMKRAYDEGAVDYIAKTDPLNKMLASIRQHLK